MALLEAATRIIVAQKLSAPTAGIAKEAGIPNGSLFTYFETKTELFNQLYRELKGEMATAALKGVLATAEPRAQFSVSGKTGQAGLCDSLRNGRHSLSSLIQ